LNLFSRIPKVISSLIPVFAKAVIAKVTESNDVTFVIVGVANCTCIDAVSTPACGLRSIYESCGLTDDCELFCGPKFANLTTAFMVALGAGLYIGFVDRLIPSQLSLPVRNNGGNS
jgi:hypothetical protein